LTLKRLHDVNPEDRTLNIVTRRPKAGVVGAEEMSTTRQLLGKHVSVELLLRDGVFCGFAQRLYNEDLRQTRVEAGSNTSTLALRAVGGEEKGTQGLGV
jgi:hypothetical protein